MTKYKCNTSLFSRNITKNKVYDLVESNGKLITIINDHGKEDDYHESYFDIVEEHVIEVGSEWVFDKNGMDYIVTAIGEQKVLCKHSTSGKDENFDEFALNKDDFNTIMKPKTVTMYFYKDCKGLIHSYSTPMPTFGDYLFTKVIEL